jgi:hypothetical protein
MMVQYAIRVEQLDLAVQDMWYELAGQPKPGHTRSQWRVEYSHTCTWCGREWKDFRMFGAFCDEAHRVAWERARQRHTDARGVRRRYIVRQAGLRREVLDKDWWGQVCVRCAKVFSYMTYPGNPRKYYEGCRVYAKREYDAARKRAKRAELASQKAQDC